MSYTIRTRMGGTICTIVEADAVRQAVEIAAMREISLSYADLSGSVLCALDAPGIDLCHADLSGSDLRNANLRDAKLLFADCGGASMDSANLFGSTAIYANFHEADLSGANLKHTDLTGAVLSDCNLAGADLFKADLDGAVLRNATGLESAAGAALALAKLRVVPSSGEFHGYKAFRNGVIALVRVPHGAKRTNGPNRWCRADTIEIVLIPSGMPARGLRDGQDYRELSVVSSDEFDESPTDEGQGISFFLTREEARAFDWSPEDEKA